ncbi:hypothetical protein [Tychonema sp. BBK16]|uniref:hypothetical protein n=1 Tax=Tychonema sp. BBK16 TaxID=2699888 RepID=UPI001F20CA1D|nr:hypothetical protein [Tychonema sp. BBK16]MCF6375959.1 hypothetical protein [Tychonema sp. BBK16]
MTDYFGKVDSVHALLQRIRRRYQMWVGDNIYELRGFLTGFGCARPGLTAHVLSDFYEFILGEFGAEHRSEGWPTVIARSVDHPMSAIPKFFELYEKFSGSRSIELNRVSLSKEQKARFMGSDQLGFARNNLSAPDVVALKASDVWGVRLVYEREYSGPYYELSVESEDVGNGLIARYQSTG